MAVKSNLIACKPEKFKASMGFKPMTLQVHQNTGSCFVVITWDCSNIPKGHLLFLQWLLFCFVLLFYGASLIMCTVFMKGRGSSCHALNPFQKVERITVRQNFQFLWI